MMDTAKVNEGMNSFVGKTHCTNTKQYFVFYIIKKLSDVLTPL